MKKLAALTTLALAFPAIAFAQGTLAPIQTLLVSVGNLISLAIPIGIGIAMVVLIWGVITYIYKGATDAAGRNRIIAGIIGLFVIISIWGIVTLMQRAILGNQPGNQINAPHFPQN